MNTCPDSPAQRQAILDRCGQDVRRLEADDVRFDLSTDSWGQLAWPVMHERRLTLLARARAHPADLLEAFARRFPFPFFLLTRQGRDAEGLLFAAVRPGAVAQNILFYSARDHQLRLGMQPLEIPQADAFGQDGFPFRGGIDLEQLEDALQRGNVSLIYLEMLSNAIGGYPISLDNLQAARELALRHGVPLFLDATRLVDNALFNLRFEPACRGMDLPTCLSALLRCCDGATLSLGKNYGVMGGGLLACHSAALFAAARRAFDAAPTPFAEPEIVAQAVLDDEYIESQVRRRLHQVEILAEDFSTAGLPLRLPPGGHALIADVEGTGETPVTWLAKLYVRYGLRAGRHHSGHGLRFQRPHWLRLTLPIDMPDPELAALRRRLQAGL